MPDLKEKIANLKEDTYIANVNEDPTLLLPPTSRRSKSLYQVGDYLKPVYMIWKYA